MIIARIVAFIVFTAFGLLLVKGLLAVMAGPVVTGYGM